MSRRRLNKHIAEALEMQIPEENQEEIKALITVDPHELVPVNNEDLPVMEDIDKSILEGEKQLESLIQTGMEWVQEMRDTMVDVDPKYRNRHIEIASAIYSATLEAVRHKTEHNLKKKKSRMDEAKFTGKDTKKSPGQVHNHYYGREDIVKMMDAEDAKTAEPNTSLKKVGTEVESEEIDSK
jgi:hypothetical protein